MGIDESKLEEVLESFRKAKAKEEEPKTKEKEKFWKTLAKYFVHGIGFSIISSLLSIAWVFIFVFLVVGGLLIGFIIGLAFLMLIVGFVNSILMSQIWEVSMQTGFWDTLFHGVVLFILLLIVGIFFIIIEIVEPSIITQVTLFILGSISRGFVAKKVGEWWRAEEDRVRLQYEE